MLVSKREENKRQREEENDFQLTQAFLSLWPLVCNVLRMLNLFTLRLFVSRRQTLDLFWWIYRSMVSENK